MEQNPREEIAAVPGGQAARPSRKLAALAACGIAAALAIGGGAAAMAAASSAPAPDPDPQPVQSSGAGKPEPAASSIDPEDAAAIRDAGTATIIGPDAAAASASSTASAADGAASRDAGAKLEYAAEETEAKTHEEAVPAETETVTEKHTVCNTCKAIVDDDPDGHLASTGHAAYTRNVPFEYVRIKTPATTKTVTDSEAKHYLVCYRVDASGNREEVSRQELGSAEEARAAAAAANAAAAAK